MSGSHLASEATVHPQCARPLLHAMSSLTLTALPGSHLPARAPVGLHRTPQAHHHLHACICHLRLHAAPCAHVLLVTLPEQHCQLRVELQHRLQLLQQCGLLGPYLLSLLPLPLLLLLLLAARPPPLAGRPRAAASASLRSTSTCAACAPPAQQQR